MIRLSGLREELKITKETYIYADREFHKSFNEKYFPEVAQKNEKDKILSTGEENEEEIKKAREKTQNSKKQKKTEENFQEEPVEEMLC